MSKALDQAVKDSIVRSALARDCERIESLVAEAETAIAGNRLAQAATAIGEARLGLERIQVALTIMDMRE